MRINGNMQVSEEMFTIVSLIVIDGNLPDVHLFYPTVRFTGRGSPERYQVMQLP